MLILWSFYDDFMLIYVNIIDRQTHTHKSIGLSLTKHKWSLQKRHLIPTKWITLKRPKTSMEIGLKANSYSLSSSRLLLHSLRILLRLGISPSTFTLIASYFSSSISNESNWTNISANCFLASSISWLSASLIWPAKAWHLSWASSIRSRILAE